MEKQFIELFTKFHYFCYRNCLSQEAQLLYIKLLAMYLHYGNLAFKVNRYELKFMVKFYSDNTLNKALDRLASKGLISFKSTNFSELLININIPWKKKNE